MKGCPTKSHLEAVALGEVHEDHAADVMAHAGRCARCRHELNWLRTEVGLFAQRAARDEVSRLWENVDRRSGRQGSRVARAVMAVAASVLLAVVAGTRLSGGRLSSGAIDEPMPMSLEMMSVDQRSDLAELPASLPCFTPGFGIACGQVELATR